MYKKSIVSLLVISNLLAVSLVITILLSTEVLADTDPPKIFSIQTIVTSNSSTISWETDEPSTSAVFYGKTSEVQLTVFLPQFITSHTINLGFLAFGTLYFFKASSCDASNNCNSSQLMNFTTLSVPPPEKITGLRNISTTRKQIIINWTSSTDPHLKGYKIYKNDINVANVTINTFTDNEVTDSSVFNYQVSAFNVVNDEGEKSDVLAVVTPETDLKAPTLTTLKLLSLTPSTAKVNWETDEDANATVKYGNVTDMLSESRKTFESNHTIELKNLQTGTLVSFTAISCDESGNCAGKNGQFVPGSDVTPPFINISLPRYFNQNVIRVIGLTEPFSEVRFFVNNVYKGLVTREKTGASGRIDFNLGGFSEGENSVIVVSEDGAGNIGRSNFTVTIDLVPPQYFISAIPVLTRNETLVINGSVNELVTVEFFVSLVSSLDFDKPEKVKGLNVVKVDKNKVELKWDKVNDSDVNKYVIYRDGLRITFTTGIEFIDSAVDTATTYQYEVSALDNSCNEGERSDLVEAVTLSNGSTLNLIPKDIELPCKEKSLAAKINASNRFNQQIKLLTGLNEVEIRFTDLAGNTVSTTNRTIFNNKPPKILRTNLIELSPSYVSEVTVQGRVSEQAVVLIFVNNGSNPDATVNTDSNGSFKADITLERNFGFTQNVGEGVGQPIAPVRTTVQSSLEQFARNDIRVVAINNVGLTDEVKGFINYAVCGGGGDWEIEIKDVYPSEIIPRYLIEGLAQIGFGMNFSYRGLPVQGREPNIVNVRVDAKFPQGLSAKDRATFDEDWVSRVNVHRNAGQKSAYVLIDIKKIDPVPRATLFQKEENLTKHGVGRCFNIPFTDTSYLNAGCVNIPLTIELTYQCEEFQQLGNQFRKATKSCVQKHCTNVNVVITPRIPPRVIPETLLKTSIKLLDASIGLIDAIVKPLQIATQFTLVGCIGTWGVYFVKKSSEYFSCLGVDIRRCSGCADGVCKIDGKDGKIDERCTQCYQAKLSTAKVWEALNYVCDRIMCPAVPSYEKYRADKLGIKEKLKPTTERVSTSISNCVPQVAQVNAKDAYDFYNKPENAGLKEECNKRILNPSGAIDAKGDCCVFEYKKTWDPAALLLDPLKESACRAAIEKTRVSYEKPEEFQKDLEAKDLVCGSVYEQLFRTVRDFSLCTDKKSENTKEINVGGDWFVIEKFEGDKNELDATVKEMDRTRGKYPTIRDTSGKVIQHKPVDDNYIRAYGGNILYTGQEIVYQESDKAGVPIVKTGRIVPIEPIYVPNECCTKGYSDIRCNPTYAKVSSSNQYAMGLCINEQEKNVICDSEKCSVECAGRQDRADCERGCREKAKSCVDRCNKQSERFQVRQKVPKAVIDVFCLGNQGKDYVIDPTSDIISSVQAGCMTGTLAYLNKYSTILKAMRGCFQAILQTGDGSAGLCRELISIYVCDLIYYAISCIKERLGSGSGTIAQEGLGGFIKFVTSASSEVQQGIQSRYGASGIYRALFVERSLIHSACIFAFTGDWDVSFNNIIQQITTVPIEPTIAIAPATRRFMSYDTTTGLVTHVYNVGAFIVPGSDNFRYRIELVCSNTNDCDPNYFENGVCDCARTGAEKLFVVQLGNGLLRFGQTLNDAKFIPISSSPPNPQAGVRYNKVRVTYSYRDNKGEAANKVKEFEVSHIGGQPPVSCKFDIGSLSYRCAFDIGGLGTGCIISEPEIYMDNKLVASNTVQKNKPVSLQADVQKNSPDRTRPVTYFAQIELTKDLGFVPSVPPEVRSITQEDRSTVKFDLRSKIDNLLRTSPAIVYCQITEGGGFIDGTPTGCQVRDVKIIWDGNILEYQRGIYTGTFQPSTTAKTQCSKHTLGTSYNCDGIILNIKPSSSPGEAIIQGKATSFNPFTSQPATEIKYKLTLHLPDEQNKNIKSNNIAVCGGELQEKQGTITVEESTAVSSDVAGLPECRSVPGPPYTTLCNCGNSKCGLAGQSCCSNVCVDKPCDIFGKIKVKVLPLDPLQSIFKLAEDNTFKIKAEIEQDDAVKEVTYSIVGTTAQGKMQKSTSGLWESGEINSKDIPKGSYRVVVTANDKLGNVKQPENVALLGISDEPCDSGNGWCVIDSTNCGDYLGYEEVTSSPCPTNTRCCKIKI